MFCNMYSRITSYRNISTARRFYSSYVIDHFNNPRNVGSFTEKNKYSNYGKGLVGAPACGDVMKLEIEVHDGIIVDVRFKTFGCGSAIASSSYATEYIKGKTIQEAKQIKNKDISQYLKLPPVKLHCSMLAEDAIKSAIEDYEKKHLVSSENNIALHTYMVEEINNAIKENEKNKKHLLIRDELLNLRRHPYIYVKRDEN